MIDWRWDRRNAPRVPGCSVNRKLVDVPSVSKLCRCVVRPLPCSPCSHLSCDLSDSMWRKRDSRSEWQQRAYASRACPPVCDDSQSVVESCSPHVGQKLFPMNQAIDNFLIVVCQIDLACPDAIVKYA